MHESISTIDRLTKYSTEVHGCWQWTGALNPDGYGMISLGKRSLGTRRVRTVHRASYEAFIGPIPEGLQIDHLCRNRACWNPAHLDPVTPRVNTLRGFGRASFNATKQYCNHGHEFTESNTHLYRGSRSCKQCARTRAGSVNVDQALRTHCPYGHPYDEQNTYVVPGKGHRQCRTCNKRRQNELKARRAAAKKG